MPSILRALVLACLAALAVAWPAQAAWHVPGCALRYVVERQGDPVPHAETGRFELCLNGGADGLRVFTADGKAVGCERLWQAEGEPDRVLFDCSAGGKTYYVYAVSGPAAASPAWKATPGLVLETRRRADGDPKDAASIMAIYEASKPVLGRSCANHVFVGIHPHGPNTDLSARFQGIFTLSRAGTYGFATLSDDASCLLVDGKVVAQWPGWHGPMEGRRGAFNGTVDLQTGRHSLTYYNVQNDNGLCVVAGWKPPGQKGYTVMPPNVFLPVVSYRVTSCEPRESKDVLPRFAWRMTGHSTVDGMSLVTAQFTCLNPGKTRTAHWSFDDGIEQKGATVSHVFCRTGMRRVRLTLRAGKRDLGQVEHTVCVHPRWTQREEWNKTKFRTQKAWLLALDLARLPVEDLAALYRVAARIEDLQLQTRAGLACMKRKADFGASHADVFLSLALHMQHYAVKRFDLADEAFVRCEALAADNKPLQTAARMHRAGMFIHCLRKIEEGLALLRSIDASVMSASDRRLKTIYEADALLALGHVGAARTLYLSAGTVVDRADTQFAIRRRGRLQTVRDYLSRGEYDAAEEIIRSIEWETPLERLNTETGLLMIRVHMARKQYRMAYSHCHRLLQVARTDARRPQILLALGRVCLATGRKEEAREVFKLLYDQHPYSEAAALARDIWPDGPR